MKVRYDMVVVGGGPVGCYAAQSTPSGFDVLLIEEHRTQPVHCAGIISISGLEKLGIKPKGSVLNRVCGAKLYSPSGIELTIHPKKPKAYVVDRARFDQEIFEKALSRGVSVEWGRIDRIDHNTLHTKGKSFEAEKIVLATGVDYSLQRKLNISRPREFLVGAQYELKVECLTDMVELYFNLPDFFTWIIPVGDYCRVGMASKDNPTPHLDSFVKKLGRDGRLKNEKILNQTYGVIPIYDPKIRASHENIALVGDAAGQVKATTGGGIVTGCLAAQHVWRDDYEQRWRMEIGRALKKHLLIHRFISKLSPQGRDRFFRMIADYTSLIEEKGDMDYPSPLMGAFAKNPGFLGRALLNMPHFLWDLLH
ncbi:geranylgeranyl reductase family protein [Candidatus Altiarchaeota archaeon]